MEYLLYYGSFLIFPYGFYIITQRQAIKTEIFIIILVFIGLFIYARFIETNILLVKKTNIAAGKLKKPLKIAVLADPHIGIFRNNFSLFKRALIKINELKPDLVFMPGDFVYNAKEKNFTKYFGALKKVKFPIYAVTGNHEHGFCEEDVSEALIKTLKKFNVCVINDKKIFIRVKRIKVNIFGLSDYWLNQADYNILKGLKKNELNLVLAHNPDSIAEFPDEPIDLVISGHTHGGQIKLPVLYKYLVPTKLKFDSGLYIFKNIKIYISSGLGTVGLPFRLFQPPTLDLIEIK